MGPRLIARTLALGAMALAVMGQSEGGLFKQPPAPVITQGSDNDAGLDFTIDYGSMVEGAPPAETAEPEEGEDPDPTLSGEPISKGPPERVDLSRPLEEGWQMDPVLLNRRQAGQPLRPDDDVTPQTFGIELRKEF